MRSRKRSWTDEQLIDAVASSTSLREIISKLGLAPGSASNNQTIRRHCVRLELSLDHLLGKAWVGKNNKPIPGRYDLADILVEHSTYPTSKLLRRLVEASLKKRECERCGLTEWLDQPAALEIDHINGVSNDHRIENLRVLCLQCHSQTPTWRGKKNKRPLSETGITTP